jgi:hypothetical protein
VESLLGEAEVSTLETKLRFERAVTFDPTVGSPSNFYRSFRTPFSMKKMLNRYSVSGGLYSQDQVTGLKGP